MDKYNLSDIFSDLDSQSSVILPKSIKIKNIKLSDTTSSFMPQKGGYSDATSSFMPQKGGYSDATSSFMPQKGGYLNNNKNKDITQLLSMLSATSDDNYTTNSTDNAKQLNKVQDGGTGDSWLHLFPIYKQNSPKFNKAITNLYDILPKILQDIKGTPQEITNLYTGLLTIEDKGAFIEELDNIVTIDMFSSKYTKVIIEFVFNLDILDKTLLPKVINLVSRLFRVKTNNKDLSDHKKYGRLNQSKNS